MKTLSMVDTINMIGQEVELFGWVDAKRDHKKIVFIDLRDRTGIVQVVGDERLKLVSSEDVIRLKGIVKERPENLRNPKMATGTIEIEATDVEILSASQAVPLPVNTDGYEIDEEVRLKYRYLDLRRPRMIKNVMMKSKAFSYIRSYFEKEGFIEVETPILTKRTAEGARDFLVPSRLQKGRFYALPQSPQQYKQLLMTAGLERYYQLARCFRDEDPRADRAYGEFTQLDLEMSFVERDDVMSITEKMVIGLADVLGVKIKQTPFPVVTYQEAMKTYGADRFDLRTEEDKANGVLAFAWVVDFPFFKKVEDAAEKMDGKSGWTFTHNPFSISIPEHREWHLKGENIDKIITSQYDLVCNGYEVGGGSIRAHTPELLAATYKIMGYTDEEIKQNIGHMLEAFSYGTPPHGGIALGMDRLLMCLAHESSLREMIPFPATSGGKTAVVDAPSPAQDEQLIELGIKVTE
jgi:aspartyl-tRNA synthetase